MADEADFGDTAATAELTAAGKDPRYTLTATELTWATELKQALIDAKVELPPTDFELAHFAIVSKGNIKKGAYRDEGWVDEDYVDPMEQLKKMWPFGGK